MAHLDRGVYLKGDGEFSDAGTAQENFQNKYDLDSPLEAMNSYARYIEMAWPPTSKVVTNTVP